MTRISEKDQEFFHYYKALLGKGDVMNIVKKMDKDELKQMLSIYIDRLGEEKYREMNDSQ